MSTPSSQLHQDLRLLDVLEALPRPTETNSDALRDRLTALCTAQSLEASPERIEQAVSHYLTARLPAVPSDTLPWERPATNKEWRALVQEQARLQADADKTGDIAFKFALATFLACFVGSIVWSVRTCPVGTWPLFGLMGGTVGFAFGLVAASTMSGLVKLICGRFPAARQRRQFQARWWAKRDEEDQLNEAKPDLDKMKRWLAAPTATDVLRQIARSPVPLTLRDALGLDELAAVDETRQQAQNQANAAAAVAQEWQRSLQVLAQPDPAGTPNPA